MRTEREWQEQGTEAAGEDWREGNRSALSETEVHGGMLAYFGDDIADASLTEQTEKGRDLALAEAARGYMTEYRRLGGIVIHETY